MPFRFTSLQISYLFLGAEKLQIGLGVPMSQLFHVSYFFRTMEETWLLGQTVWIPSFLPHIHICIGFISLFSVARTRDNPHILVPTPF